MRAGFQCFQRRQRGGEAFDQCAGGIELVSANEHARIAGMQVSTASARNVVSAWASAFAAGTRARTAQQRALERGDGRVVCAERLPEPQQRMLEQRQQRHRLEAAERDLGGEPREHAGGRVGQAHRHRNRPPPPSSAERSHHAAGERAVGRHQRGGLVLAFPALSRNATAMASASSSALAASIMRQRCERVLGAPASKSACRRCCCQRSVVAAGRRASDTSASRPWALPARARSRRRA